MSSTKHTVAVFAFAVALLVTATSAQAQRLYRIPAARAMVHLPKVHREPSRPASPYRPASLTYQAGDNQTICSLGGDMGPWLQSHGDNVMRFIVPPTIDANVPLGPACVHTAEAEGYPVYLSVALNAHWTALQDAIHMKYVIATYGPVWAISIGNEPELGEGHGDAMTVRQYADVWAEAEPMIQHSDPSAIRVYGDVSPYGMPFMREAWSRDHTGAQVVAMHCYDMTATDGLVNVPSWAAWAQSQRMPLWCSEMDHLVGNPQGPSVAGFDQLLGIAERTPDVQMLSNYYWPAYGADHAGRAAVR